MLLDIDDSIIIKEQRCAKFAWSRFYSLLFLSIIIKIISILRTLNKSLTYFEQSRLRTLNKSLTYFEQVAYVLWTSRLRTLIKSLTYFEQVAYILWTSRLRTLNKSLTYLRTLLYTMLYFSLDYFYFFCCKWRERV